MLVKVDATLKLKSGNFIVPLTIDYWTLPKKHAGFMPRERPPMSTVEIEPEPEEPKGGRSRKIEQKREQGQERRRAFGGKGARGQRSTAWPFLDTPVCGVT